MVGSNTTKNGGAHHHCCNVKSSNEQALLLTEYRKNRTAMNALNRTTTTMREINNNKKWLSSPPHHTTPHAPAHNILSSRPRASVCETRRKELTKKNEADGGTELSLWSPDKQKPSHPSPSTISTKSYRSHTHIHRTSHRIRHHHEAQTH